MRTFDKLVNSIIENNVAGGTGSVFSNGAVNIGAGGNSLNTGDTYAPGDMRVPKVLGAKRKKKGMKFPIQRRSFTFY